MHAVIDCLCSAVRCLTCCPGFSFVSCFCSRIQLVQDTVATASTLTATREAGEIGMPGRNMGKSIWYYWTAPSSGRMTVSTSGSDFDTVMGLYWYSSSTTPLSAISLVRYLASSTI